jgi:hypothetical protein
MARQMLALAVLLSAQLPAAAVPLFYNDGATHVLAINADSVAVYRSSTAVMVAGADVQGNVTLGTDPAAPDGPTSAATFIATGGRIRGNLEGGQAGNGAAFRVALSGDTRIDGDANIFGTNDFNVSIADNVRVGGDVIIERNSASTGGLLSVSGGVFSGTFSTWTSTINFALTEISGGDFQGQVVLSDTTSRISGGNFSSLYVTNGGNRSIITGGHFQSTSFAGGAVDIFDGLFEGQISANMELGSLSIFGGEFGGGLLAGSSLFGTLNVFGGLFDAGSNWSVGIGANVYGHELRLTGNRLTGFLADGNYLDVLLGGCSGVTCGLNLIETRPVSVPEPRSLALLSVGVLLLMMTRRKGVGVAHRPPNF